MTIFYTKVFCSPKMLSSSYCFTVYVHIKSHYLIILQVVTSQYAPNMLQAYMSEARASATYIYQAQVPVIMKLIATVKHCCWCSSIYLREAAIQTFLTHFAVGLLLQLSLLKQLHVTMLHHSSVYEKPWGICLLKGDTYWSCGTYSPTANFTQALTVVGMSCLQI